jgi:endonuclease G, mitochondrial
VAGGAGEGGTGENGRKNKLSRISISVPASTWKVVLVSDRPGAGIAGITEQTRTIAVIMPNKQGIKNNDWRDYRVSVDQVEALTGYDFFSNIPQALQATIEAKTDAPRAVKAPVKAPVRRSSKTSTGGGN